MYDPNTGEVKLTIQDKRANAIYGVLEICIGKQLHFSQIKSILNKEGIIFTDVTLKSYLDVLCNTNRLKHINYKVMSTSQTDNRYKHREDVYIVLDKPMVDKTIKIKQSELKYTQDAYYQDGYKAGYRQALIDNDIYKDSNVNTTKSADYENRSDKNSPDTIKVGAESRSHTATLATDIVEQLSSNNKYIEILDHLGAEETEIETEEIIQEDINDERNIMDTENISPPSLWMDDAMMARLEKRKAQIEKQKEKEIKNETEV